MDTSTLIGNIIVSMREYQKENNITKQCITNAQFIYDIIKFNSTNDVKTKSVIVFSNDKETNSVTLVGGHLVIILDDDNDVIDPSYEVFSLKNKLYFDNIDNFMSYFNEDDKITLKSKLNIKKVISDYLKFIKISEQINNGKFIITNKEFYNKQANYIENKYSKYLISIN